MHTMTQAARHLPKFGQELAAALGLEKALYVLERLGGMTLRTPMKPDSRGLTRARLVKALGGTPYAAELAAELTRLYPYERLYFPRCAALSQMRRNARIHRAAEQALRAGESMSAIVRALADQHGLSDRRVWAILKQPAPEREGEVSP